MRILNEKQKIAVNHKDGPMIVFAGPGSGKTTIIIYRIENLIKNQNIFENKILVITFSKATALEMSARFNTLTDNMFSGVTFNTFHSLFFRIIRSHMALDLSCIISDEEKKEIIKKIIKRENIIIDEDEDFLKTIILEMSLIKNEMIDVNYYSSSNMSANDFLTIFFGYENEKLKKNKIDFDDMLTKCYELLTSNVKILEIWQKKYEYILIDEFQDINKIQYEIIKLIAAPKFNLFVVGDDDQSIYKFRGSRPEFLLKFPKDISNTETVILDINYRSTDKIIGLSNFIIKENKVRYEKKMSGTDKDGNHPKIVTVDDMKAEATYVADKILEIAKDKEYKKIAVIFRTNMQARSFMEAFMNRNIPFILKDISNTIYEHPMAKDIESYFRLAIDNNDDKALTHIINKPNRYISKSVLATHSKNGLILKKLLNSNVLQTWQITRLEEFLFSLNALKKRTPYEAIKYLRMGIGYDDYILDYASYRKIKPKALYDLLDELQEASMEIKNLQDYLTHVEAVILKTKEKANKNIENGVTLTTMHSSKGLEFDTVFLAGAVEGLIPHEKSTSQTEIEEERRLFYVAVTRAKNQLYICVVNNRHEKTVLKSRFLKFNK